MSDYPHQLPTETWQISELERIDGVHPLSKCEGPCALHKPSGHHMVNWPVTFFMTDDAFMRKCPHDQWHPDPDSITHAMKEEGATHERFDHECDGCCAKHSSFGRTTEDQA